MRKIEKRRKEEKREKEERERKAGCEVFNAAGLRFYTDEKENREI